MHDLLVDLVGQQKFFFLCLLATAVLEVQPGEGSDTDITALKKKKKKEREREYNISVSVPPPCYRSSTQKTPVILPKVQVAGYS